MRPRLLALTLALTLAVAAHAAPLSAQLPISLDVSGGAARARGGPGVAGASFLSLTLLGLHARVGGEVLHTGESANGDRSLQTVAASAGVGFIMPGLLIVPRPYALVIGGQGLDWRESDHFRSLGVAAGVRGILSRLSVEVRYERLFQYGVRHQSLPKDVVGGLVGLKLF